MQTVETGKFPEEHKGKALCGQRVYRSGTIRESFHERHTADNQSEEQYEKFPDERSRQNPVEKTGFDRNGQ